MLNALKKALGGKPEENKDLEQEAPVDETLQDLTSLSVQEQLNVALASLVEKETSLADLQGQFEAMAQELEGYKEKVASLQQFADEAEAKAQAAAEEMKAKEIADKKAQLADVIGKDNPGFDTTFAALENLNSEAFNVVLSGFKASFANEANSIMFKEQGVSGEPDAGSENESATMKVLKKTYKTKKEGK